ncbi:MAG: hypothetical protein M1128_01660 [Candidatus Marsarchaeota archaeon]|nr:hypothetical protein [Candidatus Marsarchaeota archaeon]
MAKTTCKVNMFKIEEYDENLKNAINAFEHYFTNYKNDLVAIRKDQSISMPKKKDHLEESLQANMRSIAYEVNQELSNIDLKENAYSDFFKHVHRKLKSNALIEKAVINAVISELDRKTFAKIIDDANQAYKLENMQRR